MSYATNILTLLSREGVAATWVDGVTSLTVRVAQSDVSTGDSEGGGEIKGVQRCRIQVAVGSNATSVRVPAANLVSTAKVTIAGVQWSIAAGDDSIRNDGTSATVDLFRVADVIVGDSRKRGQ